MSNDKPNQFSLGEWMTTMPETFDLTSEFAERVHPIIEQLVETCRQLSMPVLVVVSNKQGPEGSYVGGYQHFAGPSRVPTALLMAMHASKLDYQGLGDVSRADEQRGKAFVNAVDTIGGIMASVTKH